MTSQVFVASYSRDFEWLKHCLLSLKKFSVGFLPPVVGVSEREFRMFRILADQIWPEVKIAADGLDGWMPAQIRMMKIDKYCDADHIFLLGSDCMVSSEFRPEPFFRQDKPVMLYNTYDHLLPHAPGVMPWKRGTERVLGFESGIESMRRVPTVHPRGLYEPMRRHVEAIHHMPFEQYIEHGEKIGGGTSETNILGSFAWRYMHDIYEWVNLDNCYDTEMPKHSNPVLQFWSKAANGMDSPSDRDMRYSGGSTLGKTPRQLFAEILGS